MNNNVVFDTIRSILLCHLNLNFEEVQPHSRIVEDLGADSLDKVELIMEFEKAFNVVIEDEEIEGISTVNDVLDLINKKI